ncbi:MAG: hypothetical protein Ct9H300mP1_08680 [Planctomycetaceae bacterium]|nr:MAG: hypothetical protein Ct9H300mP1_08680 [Planctomycetaceae bacterium]
MVGPELPGEAGLAEPGRIRFEDFTKKAGIDFHYFQSPDTATPGARMFENTGGGVAVLDFDRDGGPRPLFHTGLSLADGWVWKPIRIESKCFWIGCTATTATGHSGRHTLGGPGRRTLQPGRCRGRH